MGGLPVIPCNPKNKAPLTAHGKDDGSTDLDQIDAWWRQWPNALVGVAAPANVVILDLDVPGAAHKKLAADGVATFRALAGHDPRTAPTVVAETGSGGLHVWYTLPDDLANLPATKAGAAPGWGNRESCFKDIAEANGGATGINIRGTGKGYVIAPPSIHPDTGRPYRWLTTPPSDMRPAPAPDWLTSRMRAVVAEEQRAAEQARARAEAVARRPPTPGRPSPVARAMAHLERVEPAIQGSGGHAHTLRTTARVVCGYALTTEQAMDAFAAWNAQCSPPWSDRDLREMIDGATKLQQGRGDLLNEDRPRPAAGRPRHGGGDEPPSWACEDIPDLEFEGPAARGRAPVPDAQPPEDPPPPHVAERIGEPDQEPDQDQDAASEGAKKPRKKKRGDDRLPGAPRHHHLTAYVLPKNGYAVLVGERPRTKWMIGDRPFMRALMVREGIELRDTVDAIDSLPPCGGFLFSPPSREPVVYAHGLPHINLYRGIGTPSPHPSTPDHFPAIMALLDHLFDRGSPEFDDFLDWLAMPLQELAGGRPGWRTHLSPLLKGIPGAGKGFLGEVIADLYGEHFLKITQEQLEEDFSPLNLASMLMVMVDELESPKKWNKFKGWVTEDTIPIRDMKAQAVETPVYFNLFITSNLEKPVPVPEDDRRVYPFDCPNKLPENVIRALRAAKNAKWAEVPRFHRFLVDRPLELRRMKPRDNKSRAELIEANRDVYAEFAEELFMVGMRALVTEYADEMWPRASVTPEWMRVADCVRVGSGPAAMVTTTVTVNALTRLFRAYAADRHGHRSASPKTMWPILERRGATRVNSRRFGRDLSKAVINVPMARAEAMDGFSADAGFGPARPN